VSDFPTEVATLKGPGKRETADRVNPRDFGDYSTYLKVSPFSCEEERFSHIYSLSMGIRRFIPSVLGGDKSLNAY
jgi:hypothetical protein